MDKLVESLSAKLHLSSKYTINEVLILSAQDKVVLHSSGVDSPADKAQAVWRMWQSATQLTDVAADHLIQIKVGADQKMIYENKITSVRLTPPKVERDLLAAKCLRFESTLKPKSGIETVADIVQPDPDYNEYVDSPILRDTQSDIPALTDSMRENLRKAPSRLHDRPVSAAIRKANLDAVQSLKHDKWPWSKKFVISMAGRPWYIQAMDATHRLTVLGILGGSGYLTYVAFRGIQHNKSRKELKQQQITSENPPQ